MAEESSLLYFCFDIRADRFVYQNPALKSFMDIDEDFNFERLYALMNKEDGAYFAAKIRECMSGTPVNNMEIRMNIRGSSYWLRINMVLSKEEDGDLLLMGFAEDISLAKSYLKTLHEHNTKKNAILNILFHDLVGPMGIIKNISTLLREETGHLENIKVEKYIAVISQTTEHCIKLIRDYVNQEFLESSGIKLLKTRVDLVYRLRDTTAEYERNLKDAGITFTFNSPLEHLYMEIDEDKFMQVYHNLISNSIKFTKAGGFINITLEESDNFVILNIQDNGIGIPEQFHTTLFDRFSDAGRTGLHGEQSVGLGMSTIKAIVEWHGGTITFESIENVGSSFYINLPK